MTEHRPGYIDITIPDEAAAAYWRERDKSLPPIDAAAPAAFRYQRSAYGEPWEPRKEADTLTDLDGQRGALWLKMLPEQHHRIIDASGTVVWYHASKIAPKPGSLASPAPKGET